MNATNIITDNIITIIFTHTTLCASKHKNNQSISSEHDALDNKLILQMTKYGPSTHGKRRHRCNLVKIFNAMLMELPV